MTGLVQMADGVYITELFGVEAKTEAGERYTKMELTGQNKTNSLAISLLANYTD
jgi:hypothetical protein